MTDKDKKRIIEISKKLDKKEQIQLLKIIDENNIHYTENKNGSLINLNKIPLDIVNQILEFINICNIRKEEERLRNKFYENAKHNIETHFHNKEINNKKKRIKKNNEKYENEDNELNELNENYFIDNDEDYDYEN